MGSENTSIRSSLGRLLISIVAGGQGTPRGDSTCFFIRSATSSSRYQLLVTDAGIVECRTSSIRNKSVNNERRWMDAFRLSINWELITL